MSFLAAVGSHSENADLIRGNGTQRDGGTSCNSGGRGQCTLCVSQGMPWMDGRTKPAGDRGTSRQYGSPPAGTTLLTP